MTYLATEILLYLLAAAIIGLVMGWLVWGSGQRRKLRSLRSELMAATEAERDAHQKTREALDQAEQTGKEAVAKAKAEAADGLAELRRTLEKEREAAANAEAEIERMRVEVEEALEAGQTSGQEAVNEAMRIASVEKAAAAEAMAKEAQSRAQIEELRLLIGAEKLAAESARSELETLRATMDETLKAEREAHQQAKIALDDIRSTLARTLGPTAISVPDDGETGAQAAIDDTPPAERPVASAFSMMTDMADAGDALNNPDLDEVDSEDREDMNLDLASTVDAQPLADSDLPIAALTPDTAGPDEAASEPDRIALRPLPSEPAASSRPQGLLDQRPDEIDDLQRIDGISPEIERRLHDVGCYRYRQLVELAPDEVDWLAREIDVTAYQISADRWMEQARALIGDDDVDQGPIFLERADRENAAG